MDEQTVAGTGHVEWNVLVRPPRGHPQGISVFQHDRRAGQTEAGESLAGPQEALSRAGVQGEQRKTRAVAAQNAAQANGLAVGREKRVVSHQRNFRNAVRPDNRIEDGIRIRQLPAPGVRRKTGWKRPQHHPAGRLRDDIFPGLGTRQDDERLSLKGVVTLDHGAGVEVLLRRSRPRSSEIHACPHHAAAERLQAKLHRQRRDCRVGFEGGRPSGDQGESEHSDIAFHPRGGGRGGYVDHVR